MPPLILPANAACCALLFTLTFVIDCVLHPHCANAATGMVESDPRTLDNRGAATTTKWTH